MTRLTDLPLPRIGCWVNTCSPVSAELLARVGFDFLVIDAEHSPVEVPEVMRLIQAIQAGSPTCVPVVRVPGSDYAGVKRFVDAGAQGIIAPLVGSAAQARELVQAVLYPPLGRRGLGYCKDNGFGLHTLDRVAGANREKFLCVQIEEAEALEQLDEILGVEGVHAALIGPWDLTASMGIPGRFDHPDYLAAQNAVLAACRRHHVVPGCHVVEPDPEAVIRAAAAGYGLIGYSLDITLLTHFAKAGLEAIRESLP